MSKFERINIDTLRNDSSAVQAINENFVRLEVLLEKLLSRDGEFPNSMDALLDMNQNRITNLPLPTAPDEPVRLGDVVEINEDMTELMQAAEALIVEAYEVAETVTPEVEAARDLTLTYRDAAEGFKNEAETAVTDAQGYANAAAASAASFVATSSTSNSIGTGTKSFTTQSGKYFQNGTLVIVTRSGGSDYMYGQVSSYSGTSLSVSVSATSGSGTYTDWIISVTGIRGPEGPQGSTGPGGPGSGDVEGPSSATSNHVATFNGSTGKVIKDSGVTLGSLAAANTINNSNWSGTDLSLDNGGTGASLTDPGEDAIFFWDDSASASKFLVPGDGLTITGTTISVSEDAKDVLNLDNVDNTADTDKPISTATQTALDDKHPFAKAFISSVSIDSGTRTMQTSDIGKILMWNSSGSFRVPVTDNTTVPVGSYVVIRRHNNASSTFSVIANSGVTLQTPYGTNVMLAGLAVVVKLGSNWWVLQGAVQS